MGQAKKRGSLQERQKEAYNRLRGQLPDTITCSNCSTELSDIVPIPSDKINGITSLGVAICPECYRSTFGIGGEQHRAEEIFTMLQNMDEDEVGAIITIAMQNRDQIFGLKE